jgi:peroxiredoxin
MAALPAGTKAPDFSLPISLNRKDAGGEFSSSSSFSLQSALQKGPVLAAFFKVSCPTCQYTFPFLERLYKSHGDKVAIVGISQNNEAETAAFLKEFGVSFPTLLDDPNGYVVSNAYGLTNVPSLFLIGQDGMIEISSVGWMKQDVEEINRRLANAGKIAAPAIFKPGEEVRDFRAG